MVYNQVKEVLRLALDKKQLGINLLAARKKLFSKRQGFAERLNITVSTVSNWETGRVVPHVHDLIRVSKLTCTTMTDIFKDVGFYEKGE